MSFDDDVSDFDEGEKLEKDNFSARYEGEKNEKGERHGIGWALFSNGDQYEGEYRNGFPHGHGTYIFKNGHRYIGQRKKGLKHGKGKFYYPDGSSYEGEWKRDVRQGYGVYVYQNYDRYEGNWYKGKKHGVGNYFYHEEDSNFHGTWENGVLKGPAEIIHENSRLHTFWQEGGPIGHSVYTFDQKYMQLGYFDAQTINHNSVIEAEDDTVTPTKRVWHSTEMKKYDFSCIPQHPIPLPMMDSMESLCDSLSSSCLEEHETEANEDGEEEEEEKSLHNEEQSIEEDEEESETEAH